MKNKEVNKHGLSDGNIVVISSDGLVPEIKDEIGDVGYLDKNRTNWGIRGGQPVILDYAYDKLMCDV